MVKHFAQTPLEQPVIIGGILGELIHLEQPEVVMAVLTELIHSALLGIIGVIPGEQILSGRHAAAMEPLVELIRSVRFVAIST